MAVWVLIGSLKAFPAQAALSVQGGMNKCKCLSECTAYYQGSLKRQAE